MPGETFRLVRKAVVNALPPGIVGRIRAHRLRRTLARYDRRTVRHTYCGFPLDIVLADPLAERWYDHDWSRLPELELLERGRLRGGARVFNIGAHQCIVAAVLARIVGDTGQVVAVEASYHNIEVARENQNQNRLPQLEIVSAVVGEQVGFLRFDQMLNGAVARGSLGPKATPMASINIDWLTLQYGAPDVLFIDVEGYEVQVLRGAQQTLGLHPDVYVEVHAKQGLEEYGSTVDDVLSFFDPQQYTTYVMETGGETFVPLDMGESVIRNMFCLVGLSD